MKVVKYVKGIVEQLAGHLNANDFRLTNQVFKKEERKKKKTPLKSLLLL